MNTKNLISRCTDFFENDLWSQDDKELGNWSRKALRILKIVVMTIKEFAEQKVTVRASALTYYTLLSIIPVLALAFAIAKGFGLESLLTSIIRNNLNSTDLADYVLSFATSALENTKGGIIAGIGVIMLLYSVFKLLNNIEAAFNVMWCVRASRSTLRKVTDYVCIMIFTPLLIITAISTNVVFRSSLKSYLNGDLTPVQDLLISFSPYLMMWIFFTLLYLVMPNAKVKIVPAIISGVITGTAFQIVQWVYITFQIGVNSAGAIYGSFAFLPLLLAWLQLTWTIILAGCKIAFSIQNVSRYSLEHGVRIVSANLRRTYSLVIMYNTVCDFEAQKRTPGIAMANQMEISQPLFFHLADRLKDAGLLAELKTDNDKEERTFIPAMDTAQITPRLICQRLNALGDDKKMHIARTKVFQTMESLFDSDQPIALLPIQS